MISTWINERLSAPPTLHINDEVHQSQQQEGEAAHTHHIGQRPGETESLNNNIALPKFGTIKADGVKKSVKTQNLLIPDCR